LYEGFLNAESLGRGLKETDESVQFSPALVGELLLNVEEWRVGNDREDLNGEKCDLLLLLARDKKRDLDDNFGVVEEGLVDWLLTFETSELFGTEGDGRFGEGGKEYLEEGRLYFESSSDDAERAKHARGEEGSSSYIV
jgi:hypothetical protein